MVASITMVIPMIVRFFAARRYFLQGIAMTDLRGGSRGCVLCDPTRGSYDRESESVSVGISQAAPIRVRRS